MIQHRFTFTYKYYPELDGEFIVENVADLKVAQQMAQKEYNARLINHLEKEDQ